MKAVLANGMKVAGLAVESAHGFKDCVELRLPFRDIDMLCKLSFQSQSKIQLCLFQLRSRFPEGRAEGKAPEKVESPESMMIKDIEFLTNQLTLLEHAQDVDAIKTIRKKYRIKDPFS